MFQAVTMLGCAALGRSTPTVVILVVLFAEGASRSLQFTSLNSLAYADVPEQLMNTANTIFSIAFQLAQGFGVALAAVMLRVAGLVSASPPGTPTSLEFRLALVGFAVLMVLATLNVLRLAADAGDNVARGKPAKG